MPLWHPGDEELLSVRWDSFWGMRVWPGGRVSNVSRFMRPCGHDEEEGKTSHSATSTILMGIHASFGPQPPSPRRSPTLTRFHKDCWLQRSSSGQLDELAIESVACSALW